MRRLSRLEWIFILLGATVSVASAISFFYGAEKLGVWFGLLTESEQRPLGKLEYSISNTQRKTKSSPSFFIIGNQQKVFDRDTILTQESSEAVLSLSDGGSIDVGPDSLVELIFRDTGAMGGSQELVLNVKKGSVS